MNKFRSLSIPERAAAFEKLSPYIQQTILKQLRINEIVDLLDHMDMQLAEKVLTRIGNPKLREKILRRLKGEVKEKLEYFLRFHPKATLSLINFNYLFLDGSLTIKKAAELISEHYEDTARYPEVLVHDNGALIGEVPLSSIVKERNTSTLKKFVQPVQTITYQAEINEVIELLVTTNSKKVVVLDHDTSVLGIIYADAAKNLFGNLPAESLYDFAGVDDSERPFDSVSKKVHKRYRWLILNLATTFIASSVILGFQNILNAFTILTIYIPVVSGMAGNAATQTFAIMVRGITLGTISLENSMPAIMREIWAGIINGAIIGLIVSVVAVVWNGNAWLGLVVALALVAAHTVAALAGAVIPLLMKHFGKDPAATSTIFISTVTDVTSLFFLLGIASLVMM